jgi:3-hydroxyisobutyrate dehydrogenase-like beta-hydroxyacid dehydrogenase
LSEGGVLSTLKPNGIHVSMSTISSELSRKLVGLHQKAGSVYIAAPVFGRPPAAAAGALGVIAAGDLAIIEKLKSVFEILGKRTFIIGEEVGQANIVKLGGNFMLFSAIEAMSEAFAMTRKAGVDPAMFYEVFTNTLFAGSPVHAGYGKMIVDEKFEQTSGFKTHLALKDVKLVLKESDQLEVPMPHASMTRDIFLSMMGRGGRENDVCSMGKHAYDNSGISGKAEKKGN